MTGSIKPLGDLEQAEDSRACRAPRVGLFCCAAGGRESGEVSMGRCKARRQFDMPVRSLSSSVFKWPDPPMVDRALRAGRRRPSKIEAACSVSAISARTRAATGRRQRPGCDHRCRQLQAAVRETVSRMGYRRTACAGRGSGLYTGRVGNVESAKTLPSDFRSRQRISPPVTLRIPQRRVAIGSKKETCALRACAAMNSPRYPAAPDESG